MYSIERMLKQREEEERDFNAVVSAQNGNHAVPRPAFFVGGKYHGLYMTHDELRRKGNGTFTPRWSAMKVYNDLLVNLNLEDQPMVDGYLSPCLDGGYLRYETDAMD